LAEIYTRWADKTRRSWRFRYSAYPTKSAIVDILTNLKGETYPEEQWRAAAEVRQQALREERSFIIDTHCNNRSRNAGLDYDQLNDVTRASHRPYKNYLLSLSQIEGPDNTTEGTRDVLLLPVGEYGPEATEKLLRLVMATSDLIKTAPPIDRGIRDRLDQDDKRLLAAYTARSRERSEDNMKDFAVHGVKNTLTEGMLSAAQTISMLTAQKIDGYSHDELVAMILGSDIIEQFTRLVQPAYIGPTTLSGVYLKDAMVIRDGKPVLSKEAIAVLGEMRKRHIEDILAEWALYEEGKGEKPTVLGLVCPAAAPNGAITTVKRALKPFYETNGNGSMTQLVN
jgi:hypothetical protein